MARHWEHFAAACTRFGGQIALLDDSTAVTFADLHRQASERAEEWKSQGLDRGDVVALVDSLDGEGVVSLLAAWKAECRPLMVPPWLGAEQRTVVLGRVGVRAVWGSTGGLRMFERAARAPDRERGEAPCPPGDAFFLTAGTAGVPKVVAHSTESLLAGLRATIAVQQMETSSAPPGPGGEAPGDFADSRLGLRFMACMPVCTMAGFTVLQRTLLTGESVVLSTGTDTAAILQRITRHSVNSTAITPFLARKLLRQQRVAPSTYQSLVTIGIGGSRVADHIVSDVEEAFGCLTLAGFGMTETAGPVIMGSRSEQLQIRTSYTGRALPHAEARLTDLVDDQEHRHEGLTGSLEIRSESMMLGYVDERSALDASVFLDGRWFPTGDIAMMTSSGLLRVLGRRGTVIVRGGRNIDPSEIEAVLDGHVGIARSVVRPLASAMTGEDDIEALVQLTGGVTLDEETLRRICVESLPPLLVPRRITVVDRVPVATDGEVQRRQGVPQ